MSSQLAAAEVSQPPLPPPARLFAELQPLATLSVGATADWVAASDTEVWVGASGPDSAVRIDTTTNTVTNTIALPGAACGGLAIGFGYLWAPLCAAPPALARIDLKTRRLDKVFPVGPPRSEGGVAISRDSVWLVTDADGSLSRINPNSGAVTQVIKIPPNAANLLCVGGTLYVTRADGAEVLTVNAQTGALERSFMTGPQPHFLTAGDGCVWTLNQGDGSLSAIELATGVTRHSVPLGTPGPGGDVAYGAGRVWTTMFNTALSVTRADTGEIERQWRGTGGDALDICGDVLWLTDYQRGKISRYSIAAILA